MSLIDSLIKDNYLKTPNIIKAFREIKRRDFMPKDIKELSEADQAMPIGYDQTISQPLVVAFMLELLQPKKGEKILDVGSGSGWTTALLAHIVSQQGNPKSQIPNPKQIQNPNVQNSKPIVIAIEIIQKLKEFGEKNTAKYSFTKKGIAKFVCDDGSLGYPAEAPFDKILASASAKKIPKEWKKQLKINGRIVMSINSSIWLFCKKSEKEFEEKEYPGFAFVRLV